MNLETLVLLCLLVLVVYCWYSTLKTREFVTLWCQRFCRDNNLQLLDQTVALRSFSIQRQGSLLFHLVRYYQFEVSEVGDDRLSGLVTVVKGSITMTQLLNNKGQNVVHQHVAHNIH